MSDRIACGSDQCVLKDFKLVTKVYSVRSGTMCNVVINKVRTCDYPDFIKHRVHCKHINNVLLNLGLGHGPLLNSNKNRFTREELGRDVLKCAQLESKRRRVEIESENDTTEVEDDDKETTDCEVTDNEEDNESVESVDLLEGL